MRAAIFPRQHVVLALVWHKLVRRLRSILGIKKTVYVQERVSFYREMWAAAARKLGFEFVEHSGSIWEVRQDGRVLARMNNYIVSIDDPVTLDMAGDKLLTYRLLESAGVSIPAYSRFSLPSLQEVAEFTGRVRGPYVVKPARNTASGLGVTTRLRTRSQCLFAAGLALSYCDEVLIEEHVAGESYRLLFLGDHLLCASRRRGVRVTGDGRQSIAALVASAFGADCGGAAASALAGDGDVLLTLAHQKLGLDTVPASGAEVLVRSSMFSSDSREVRTVYDEDVTEMLCPEIVEEARVAGRALGSRFCGVDVITTSLHEPLRVSGGVINEINTTPGLHHHYDIGASPEREPLAETVLKFLAADCQR